MSISSANLQTLYHCVCCIPRLLSSLSVQLRTGVLLRVLTCSDSVEEQTTEEEGGCNTCRTAVAQCIFLHAFLHMPVSRRIWNILDCISNSLIREDPLTLTILHVILPNTVAARTYCCMENVLLLPSPRQRTRLPLRNIYVQCSQTRCNS